MPATRTVRLNNDTSFLKLIAIVSMLIDHLGARIFPEYEIMRIIGRLAFPIFAYSMAVGCVYTKNIAKYALRIGILAVLVQPLYTTAMGHQVMGGFDWVHNFYRADLIVQHYWYKPNILFSLLLGVLLIWSIKDKKFIFTAALALILWYTKSYLDYGINGILLMLLFYAFIDRPVTSFVWVTLFMWYMGMPGFFSNLALNFGAKQLYAILALPLIYLPMNTGFKLNKYVFYVFYPAHLLLIYLLQLYL